MRSSLLPTPSAARELCDVAIKCVPSMSWEKEAVQTWSAGYTGHLSG